jgi:hypothetical protein
VTLLKAFSLFCLILALAGCTSAPTRAVKTYQSGEKAEHAKLIYSVVDAQIFTRLGEEPGPRIPQNRFYVVQISISNSGNKNASIGPMTLVDDAGKMYPELADGTNIPRWLGVVRTVDPAQTETGYIVFDAPSAHYKLRVTDETDEEDVFVDMPLNFLHEQMNHSMATVPDERSAPNQR